MKIGIDKIGFYTPPFYIDMKDLATWRGIDPNKFTIGLGQDQMAVTPLTQDTLTMAVNAAHTIVEEADRKAIDLVIFATETALDHSKALSVYAHRLLNIQPKARCIEVKEACYAATAAIMMAKNHVSVHPDSKVLILASDISRYGLNTSGEPTQGAGAVAMIISQNPKIAVIENESSYYTDDIMDFWRPTYSDEAIVDGKFSNEQYQRFFNHTYEDYKKSTNRTTHDFNAFCFHIPYSKIGSKALKSIVTDETHLFEAFDSSVTYNRRVGNIYTGSLYLSLLSLLENAHLPKGSRVGLFSYGSGAVAEFFSIILVENYKNHLTNTTHTLLNNRTVLDKDTYEMLFNETLPHDGSTLIIDTSKDKSFCVLDRLEDHKRIYTTQ